MGSCYYLDIALTYGELIDYIDECEDDPKRLLSKFKDTYPSIYIGRADRFYETVRRIVAPTRPSLRGGCSLSDLQIAAYRKRIWKPRIHNTSKFSMSCMNEHWHD